MNDPTPPAHGRGLVIWLGLLAVLVAAMIGGVGYWYVENAEHIQGRGHGWFVYPASKNTKVDMASGGGKPSAGWPKNVAVWSVEEREEVVRKNITRERLIATPCHVLLALSDDAPKPSGGGGGSDRPHIHHEVSWHTTEGDQSLQTWVEAKFHLTDRTLIVEEQTLRQPLDANVPRSKGKPNIVRVPHGPFPTTVGNVFLVRIDADLGVTVEPLSATVNEPIDAARLNRLLASAPPRGE